MNLLQAVQDRIRDAIKGGGSDKGILRVLVSEIQNFNVKKTPNTKIVFVNKDGVQINEDEFNLLRSMLKNNKDTISKLKERNMDTSEHEFENLVLEKYMPEVVDSDEISKVLLEANSVYMAILNSPKEGSAVGIAMKHLKEVFKNKTVNALDVKNFVSSIYGRGLEVSKHD